MSSCLQHTLHNQSRWLKMNFWLTFKTGRIQILARPPTILRLLMVFLGPVRQMLEQYLKLHNNCFFPNTLQVIIIQCYIVWATVPLNTQCNATHNWIIIPDNNYITLQHICAVHLLNHNVSLQTTVLCDEQFLLLHFYTAHYSRSGVHPEFFTAWNWPWSYIKFMFNFEIML